MVECCVLKLPLFMKLTFILKTRRFLRCSCPEAALVLFSVIVLQVPPAPCLFDVSVRKIKPYTFLFFSLFRNQLP